MGYLPGMPGTTGRGTSVPWILASGALALTLLATLTSGCDRTSPEATSSVSSVPEVHVVKPELRNLTCTVDQPGFVEAYEQTAIYSKVSGFIKKYYVDIGQAGEERRPLAEIFVPELDEDHQQKVAQVDFDQKMVEVAESKLQTAIAQLAEAKANVGRYQADIVRWESEVRPFDANGRAAGRGPGGARRNPEATLRESSPRATPPWRRWPRAMPRGSPPKPTWKPPRPKSRWPRRMSAAPQPCWPIRKSPLPTTA